MPWHTVSTDLFEAKNSRYLLPTGYYSRLSVLHKLGSSTPEVLIQETKAVSTALGVPNIIVTELRDFTKQWQVEHRFSLPRKPQSNGMGGSCVQTMKASLIETMEEGEGPTHIVPARLQESYRQFMNQGKQVQAQLYNKNS